MQRPSPHDIVKELDEMNNRSDMIVHRLAEVDDKIVQVARLCQLTQTFAENAERNARLHVDAISRLWGDKQTVLTESMGLRLRELDDQLNASNGSWTLVLQNLTDTLENLKLQVDATNASVAGLEGRLDRVNAAVLEMHHKLDTQQANDVALHARVAAIEQRCAVLDGNIGSVRDVCSSELQRTSATVEVLSRQLESHAVATANALVDHESTCEKTIQVLKHDLRDLEERIHGNVEMMRNTFVESSKFEASRDAVVTLQRAFEQECRSWKTASVASGEEMRTLASVVSQEVTQRERCCSELISRVEVMEDRLTGDLSLCHDEHGDIRSSVAMAVQTFKDVETSLKREFHDGLTSLTLPGITHNNSGSGADLQLHQRLEHVVDKMNATMAQHNALAAYVRSWHDQLQSEMHRWEVDELPRVFKAWRIGELDATN